MSYRLTDVLKSTAKVAGSNQTNWKQSEGGVLQDQSKTSLVGAVLQQLDNDGHLRPLEFYSKKWNAAEFNYSTPDKELYGLVLALKHWYQWLYGATEVIVYTDYKSLRDFSKTKLLKPRHARWALVLEDYKGRMKVHGIPGKKNTVADAASRDPNFALSEVEMKERAEHQVLPTEAFPTEDHIDSIMVDLENKTEVEHHSKGSSLLDSTVRNGNGEGSDFPLSVSFRSPDEQEILDITENHSHLGSLEYVDQEGEQEKKASLRECQKHQVNISENPQLKQEVLELHHDRPLAGHYGYNKTLDLILRKYWCQGMAKEIKEYVNSDTCQRNKVSRLPPAGSLLPLPVPERNWQHLTMDFMIKLPPSKSDDSILVVVDRRSKAATFIPINEAITAEATARLICNRIICQHGVPQSITTDRGPQFKSRFWKALLNLLGSKSSLSTAYHLQTDGQSERVNQELEAYLRCFTSYNQDDWADLLPQAEFAHNKSVHSSTGMSPFFATTGQDAEGTGSIKLHFDEIYQHVNEHLKKSQERYKQNVDKRRREEDDFKVKDEVMVSTKNVRTERPTKKLDYKWMWPYLIKRKINNVAYEVELPRNIRIHPVFHVSLLKRYIRPTDSSRQLPKPPPIQVADEDGYVIKEILDVRRRSKGFEYLIDWEGFGAEDRTWKPRKSLNDDTLLKKSINNILTNHHHSKISL
ncbi:hypothetical protein SeLEV6574_g02779 [Synchytrium endobioticum]|uniref:Integrase catalytic domain-containing protein n=1 Tax=Synchytrium endobioticum TaxID=286115 RepID=A0A507D6Y3_9FUNG|nr:hypothetical protein SeLEV6574_g02779 [Synchytrium endobioticum]